jgi:RNA polymerase sigma-70 factor, ECF subfamily
MMSVAQPSEGARGDRGVDGLNRSEAFEWFFRAQFPAVRRSVFLIVGDVGRAEEIAQDAFVQLYRHWRRVETYERPEAWVRKVAVRLAMKRVRRDRLRASLERRTWDPEPLAPDTGHDLDVLRAVARLPPAQRAVVVLHYYEDRPLAEIAEIVGCTPSTAKVHAFKARRRLAVLLGEADDVEEEDVDVE